MVLDKKEIELYNQLDDGIWSSKGSRFLTHKKYKSILNLLKFFNTSFSFLLICIGIYKISGKTFLEQYTIEVDVLLLVLSIYIFSSSFYLYILEQKVNNIFNNATDLSKLLRDLKLVKTNDDLSEVSDKYNKLEKELNQDYIDYKMWCNQVIHNKHKNDCLEGTFYFIVWHIYSKFPLVLFIVTSLILFYSNEILSFLILLIK